ncbi:MAG: transporter substrate-binding protein [Candidatus Dependentiae bacterium]|nr:transporter substrate-binding protein [Candidatus Dependentiae bacterium]
MARTLFGRSEKKLNEAALRVKSFNIAVLSKDKPLHNRLLAGIIDELATKTIISPLVTLVPGELAWNETYEAARILVKKKPDAIVTVGALCSQAMRYVLNEEKLDIPLFFGGVDRPDFLGLVPSLASAYRSTGINDGQPLHIASAHILSFIKPSMRHVLIPYSVSFDDGGLTNAAALAKRYFESKNIKATVIPLCPDEMAIDRLAPFLGMVDTVMCFEGCSTQTYQDELITRCNNLGVTIFAGDISMVQAGAAIGFVLDHGLIGRALATYIYKALWLNVPLTSLPIRSLGCSARRLAINEASAGAQGIVFDEVLLHMLKNGRVYGKVSLGDAGVVTGLDIPKKEADDL